MSTKTITINGKKVKCRALRVGERILPGDVWRDGRPFGVCGFQRENCLPSSLYCLYRPIKTAKPKQKAGVKAVKAWAKFYKEGSTISDGLGHVNIISMKQYEISKPEWDAMGCWLPVLITPIKRRGK